MQRDDSGTEGSSSSFDTTPASMSASERREATLLRTSQTIASPANIRPSTYTFTAQAEAHTSQRKDKHRATYDVRPPESVPVTTLQSTYAYTSPLSPSMLSSSSYKSINLTNHMSGPDEPARIITYTKHSQGFTWNDELFLPSYLVGRRYRGSKARRRWGQDDEDDMDIDEGDLPFDEEADRCPVADIFVTDEEAAAMLP